MNTKLNIESIIDGSIEKGKLAESVQESLNKADNAVQSITINGESKTPDEYGDINLGNIEGGGAYMSTLVYNATSRIENTWSNEIFGTPIIKHNYDESMGVGVLYFNGIITTIGDDAFNGCSSLTSIIIPDTVTSIGGRAFYSCTNLTSIAIPYSVTTIGERVFYNCRCLTSVTIPDGVKTIGYATFSNCDNLTSVTIPESVTTIGEEAFYGCKSLTSITIPDSVTTIGGSAFASCLDLTSVTIPDSVTTIGDYAFYICPDLRSVTIGDGVTTIGNQAFATCNVLASVYCKATTPPAGTSNMFSYNAYDRKIYVPMDSVEAYKSASGWSDYKSYIVGHTFNAKVQSITINGVSKRPDENGVIDLGNIEGGGGYVSTLVYKATSKIEAGNPWDDTTFGAPIIRHDYDESTGVGVIYFNKIITTIGDAAFNGCTNLTSVIIPDSVTTIGIQAFRDCSGLTRVTIPEGVTTIGDYAFSGCSSLTNITIPDSVTTIGVCAFNGCTSLTSITIPDSVTTIGERAFRDCTRLTNVYCRAITPPIALIYYDYWDAFYNNASGRKIYVPMDSVETYKSASYWSEYADDIVGYIFNFEKIYVSTLVYTATSKIEKTWNNEIFGTPIIRHDYDESTGVGVIYFNKIITTIGDAAFNGCTSLTSITIPNSVTTIGNGAFANCSSLTRVTIPDSVTTIGEWAFQECSSLTSVTIPDSVTTIGRAAFFYCSSLTSVTIPDSVTKITWYGFRNCSSLTSVTIPDSVTTIENSAFNGCTSLTSVTIPDSVTTIEASAFLDCTSLTSVYCKAITPPTAGASAFAANNNSGRKIYVPMESVEAYKSAWSDYADDIVGYIFNANVQSITINGESKMPDENGIINLGNIYVTTLAYTATSKIENTEYPWDEEEGKYTFGAPIIEHEFSGNTGVIYFRGRITTIGYGAFANCSNLTSIMIPDSVTTIGEGAFADCISLTSITIPDSVTTIGVGAFIRCSSLTSVTIPDSVTSIGNSAFYGCTSLTSVTIPDSVTTIGRQVFYDCTGELVVNCNIPSVSNYDYSAFYGSKFTSVTIGDSVTTIGEMVFYGCTSLTSVTIGDSVTTIGGYAFNTCSSLTSITIGDSVTSIGNSAFYNCYRLTSVTIPDSVTSIGNSAFYGCNNLTSVYCKAVTPPTGGTNMFARNASSRMIYVPTESVEAYKSATGWSNYTSAIVGYRFDIEGIYTYYPVTNVDTPTYTILPNTFYKFGSPDSPLSGDSNGIITIDLDSEITNIVSEYIFEIYTNATIVPTLDLPDDIKWVSGNAPVLEENKTYQISIINKLGAVLSWDNA